MHQAPLSDWQKEFSYDFPTFKAQNDYWYQDTQSYGYKIQFSYSDSPCIQYLSLIIGKILTFMQPFLKKIAQTLYQKHGKELGEIEVVLPTRRACVYFRHYLAEVSQTILLAPDIMAMDDFIKRMANVEWQDPVTLLFELYRSFRQFDTSPENDLERFAPLGNAMLKDFSMIDKNITPKQAKELFEYLDELKAIDRWAEEQLGRPVEVKEGSSLQGYFNFWKHLTATFFHFREKLMQEGKAYSGLAYRLVFEHLEEYLANNEIKKVAFIGFNQMSRAEEHIIAKLIKIGKAETYWDADQYYLKNPHQEAGDFIRKYSKLWLPKPIQDIRNDFKELPRKINIVQVGNIVSQAKLAGDLLLNLLRKVKKEKGLDQLKNSINHTAILLPDESLLMAVLHALPLEEAKKELGIDLASLINITMGVSIANTPLFGLIEAQFKMQERLVQQGNQQEVYYKDAFNILNNPLTQALLSSEELIDLQGFIQQSTENNLIYIPLQELQERNPLYEKLFMPWQGKVQNAIQNFYHLIEHFSEQLPETASFNHAFFMHLYTTLHQIENSLYQQKFTASETDEKSTISLEVTLRTFKQFLFEALKNASVPFTGEPLSPIQIMGMLESRALDFEHIILLSCNEGTVPPGKLLDSILPFDLRRSYQLPTHKESDSSVAYVFYRMFQEAKELWLVHTDPTATEGRKEKSRFLRQVEQEFTPQNGFINTEIKQYLLSLNLPTQQTEGDEITKDSYVLSLVKERFKKGLSPSAINTYIKNPLLFFQRSVLKLQEPQIIEEDLASNTFGTLVHETLDQLFQDQIGSQVSASFIQKVLDEPKEMRQLMAEIAQKEFGGLIIDQGKNFILMKVAERLVRNFLVQQIEKEAGYQLIDQENFLGHTFYITLPNQEKIPFRIAGKADRIDLIQEGGRKILRVVDYKTGSFTSTGLKASSIDELLRSPEKGKIIQLMLYKYLLIKAIEQGKLRNLPKDFSFETYEIQSGFFFFKQLEEGFVQYKLDAEKNLDISDFCSLAEKFLSDWAIDVLDDTKPFTTEPSLWEHLINDVVED